MMNATLADMLSILVDAMTSGNAMLGSDAVSAIRSEIEETQGTHVRTVSLVEVSDPFADTYPSETWCARNGVDRHTDVTCQLSLTEAGVIAAEFEANC